MYFESQTAPFRFILGLGSLFHPDSFQPFQYAVFGVGHTVTGDGIAVEHCGILFHFTYGLDRARKTAAAVCTERYDGLAAEIVFVEERVERHRHVVPPVGKSDEHNIIFVQVFDMCSQFRTGICIDFDFCRIDQFLMRTGVGVCGFYLEDIAVRRLAYD